MQSLSHKVCTYKAFHKKVIQRWRLTLNPSISHSILFSISLVAVSIILSVVSINNLDSTSAKLKQIHLGQVSLKLTTHMGGWVLTTHLSAILTLYWSFWVSQIFNNTARSLTYYRGIIMNIEQFLGIDHLMT